MNSDPINPYESPLSSTPLATQAPPAVDLVMLNKVNAIIKDAGQFWLAILLCLFCTGLGAIIIGPWHFVRLMQWMSVAKAEPRLLDTHASPGSIAKKFQSAKVKLIIGMSFGLLILLFVLFAIVAAMAQSPV